MCLAKACAAAFSLVTTMTLSDESITSRPAIIAAAERGFPAPYCCHLASKSYQPPKGLSQRGTERLCLGCGLRVEENFTPIFPGERGPLFAASVKLLQFALRASSASATDKGLTEDEGALLQAIRPLVTNPDCHFLAVLTALVQSILEGAVRREVGLFLFVGGRVLEGSWSLHKS